MYRLSFFSRILTLVALMVASMATFAQEGCQYDKLFVDWSATESTCQRNGTLTFTPRGEHLTNYQGFTYEIRSMVAGGVNIPAAAGEDQGDGSFIIRQVPSGSYRVIVRATCIADATYSLQDYVLENVVVPGNYKVPNVYFDGFKSRESYAACPSGKIVLDVSGGSGQFAFEIVESPNNAFNGPVTGITNSGTSYSLPLETYTAGPYKIEVHDLHCDYTAVTNFQLGEMSELPILSGESSYQSFYPITTGTPNCHKVRVSMYAQSSFYNNRPGIQAAIEAGFYEFGLAYVGEEPAEWYPVKTSGTTEVSLGTHKVNEFYGTGDAATNKLQTIVRLRDCPEMRRAATPTFIRPAFNANITNYCGYSMVRATPWTDYDGNYCFPLTLKAYESEAAYTSNPNDFKETAVLNNYAQNLSIQLKAGESRYVVVTDADGIVVTKRLYTAPSLGFYRGTSNEVLSCDGFYAYFYYNGASCQGVKYRVFNYSDPENQVLLCDNMNPSTLTTCLLPYDTPLRAELVVPNPDGEGEITFSHYFSEPFPDFSVSLSYVNVDHCLTNVAQFRVNIASGKYMIGAQVKVTGPNGFIQEYTFPRIGYYHDLPKVRMDPGTYELEVRMGDCYVRTATLTVPSLLEVKSFSVAKSRDCAEMKVYPTGMITYTNTDVPTATYYSIASGPEGGYNPNQRITQTQAANGAYFSLTKPGTYMVGISYYNNCNLQLLPVEFERTNLRLDNVRTIAFACLDNSTSGHIYVRATEGYGDYTYRVFDEDNEEEQLEAIGQVVGDRVYFRYGEQSEIYTLRIEDGCGNRFSQQIEILDLSNQTAGSAVRSTVCVGDPIEFTSLPLGTYYWEKETSPNSGVYEFFSDEQNPIIEDAQPSHSGRYRVTLEAAGCIQKSVGYVNISVVPCYAPVNPALMNKYGNF